MFSWAQKRFISELDAKHALLVVTDVVFLVVREWLWGLNGDVGNGHLSLLLNEAGASPVIKPCRRSGLRKEMLLCVQLLSPPVPSSKGHLRHLQQSWSPWIPLWSAERKKYPLGRIWSMNIQNRSEKLYFRNAYSFPVNKKKSLGWIAPACTSVNTWNMPYPSMFARGGERQIRSFKIEVKYLGYFYNISQTDSEAACEVSFLYWQQAHV